MGNGLQPTPGPGTQPSGPTFEITGVEIDDSGVVTVSYIRSDKFGTLKKVFPIGSQPADVMSGLQADLNALKVEAAAANPLVGLVGTVIS